MGDIHCGKCTPKTCPTTLADGTPTATEPSHCPSDPSGMLLDASDGGDSGYYSGDDTCISCAYQCNNSKNFYDTDDECQAAIQGEGTCEETDPVFGVTCWYGDKCDTANGYRYLPGGPQEIAGLTLTSTQQIDNPN